MAIKAIEFTYLISPDAGDEGHGVQAQPSKYRSANPPTVGYSEGKVRLYAVITFEKADGTTCEQIASAADAGLTWRIVASYDEAGSSCAALARIENAYADSNYQDALLTALSTGNGKVVVRCTSSTYPDFAGADITIRIEGNAVEVQPESGEASAKGASKAQTAKRAAAESSSSATEEAPVITSAYIVYNNLATGEYEVLSSEGDPAKPTKIPSVDGTCALDVLVTYSDGSQVRASEAGIEVAWSALNNVLKGVEVVSINNGVLSLSKAGSKLVQVKASIGGTQPTGDAPSDDAAAQSEEAEPIEPVEPVSCIAYVELVDADYIKAPEEGETLAAVEVYTVSGGFAHGTEGELSTITLDKAEGSLALFPIAQMLSKAGTRTAYWFEEDPGLFWQIVSFFDESGDESNTLLARIDTDESQIGMLTALGAGNGLAIVRALSSKYPDFTGQEVLVSITNNEPASQAVVEQNTVEVAQLVYYDEASETYEDYSGYKLSNTPTAIDEPFGSVDFDVRLQMQDGTSVLASELGIGVDWVIAGNVSTTKGTIATLDQNGTVTATNRANGNVRIAAPSRTNAGTTVLGIGVEGLSAYVRITNNDSSVKPLSQLSIEGSSNYWLRAGQLPDNTKQKWAWLATAGSAPAGYSVPLLITGVATSSGITLESYVRWTNDVRTAYDRDGAERVWSVLSCVDFDGNACGPLVTVSPNGVVAAAGNGSGFATIQCVAKVPVYNDEGVLETMEVTGTYKIAVFEPKSYVSKIEMLDEDEKVIPTSSITIESGKNLYHFAVRITFRGFDRTEGMVEKSVIVTDSPKHFGEPGYEYDFGYGTSSWGTVEWGVFRSEEATEPELYSTFNAPGWFQALSGFNRGYVRAIVKGSALDGADMSAGTMVFRENVYEYIGSTDYMTVKIYHYSDYQLGDAAPVAREVTLSRSQLAAFADYTTWYTFQRRNESFSTVYASGLSISRFLTLVGVDSSLLQGIIFVGLDGYAPERHSADFMLGTQLRFHNYYYRNAAPGRVTSETVSPMIALSYYVKAGDYDEAVYDDRSFGNNVGWAGFNYMTSDSTFRIVFGMRGIGVNNAAASVSRVNEIILIVDDEYRTPDEEDLPDPEDEPDPSESDKEGREDGSDDGSSHNDDGDDEKQQGDDDQQETDDRGKDDEDKAEPDETIPDDEDPSNPDKPDTTPEERDVDGDSDHGTGGGDGDNTDIDPDTDDNKQGADVTPTDDDNDADSGKQEETGEKESQSGNAEGDKPDLAQLKEDMVYAVDEEGNVVELASMPTPAYLRELAEKGGTVVIPPAELENPWSIPAAVLAVLSLLLGAAASRKRYVVDRLAGEHAKTA